MSDTIDERTPGQRAFEAFCDARGGPVLSWLELSPKEQQNWTEAAYAVMMPGADGLARHRMAKEIRIERHGFGQLARLYIDGQLFPYYTSDGFGVHPRRGEMPQVDFTVVAEAVLVTDCSDAPRKDKTDASNAG
jgi:hypothetical protein